MRKSLFSGWIVAGVIAALVGGLFDTVSLATDHWGKGEAFSYRIKVGLWKVCKTPVTIMESGDFYTGNYTCSSLTDIDDDWFKLGLTMELVAFICTVGTFASVLIFLASLKYDDWFQSRAVVAAIIPFSFLAGIMNCIGVVTIATNLDKWGAGVVTIATNLDKWGAEIDYSAILDTVSIGSYGITAVAAVADMERLWMRKRPEFGTIGARM